MGAALAWCFVELRDQVGALWGFLAAMAPVFLYFTVWFVFVRSNAEQYASYDWTMWMNRASAVALNGLFSLVFDQSISRSLEASRRSRWSTCQQRGAEMFCVDQRPPREYKDLVFAFCSDFNDSVFAFFAVSLYGAFSFKHSHCIGIVWVELA